jgi:hypothetical protein
VEHPKGELAGTRTSNPPSSSPIISAEEKCFITLSPEMHRVCGLEGRGEGVAEGDRATEEVLDGGKDFK